MSDVTYGGNLPQITNSAEELIQITQKIQETITDLETQAESSLQTWEGQVRETYHQKKRIWDNAANEMAAAARRAGVNLGQIGQEYISQETRGTNMWQ